MRSTAAWVDAVEPAQQEALERFRPTNATGANGPSSRASLQVEVPVGCRLIIVGHVLLNGGVFLRGLQSDVTCIGSGGVRVAAHAGTVGLLLSSALVETGDGSGCEGTVTPPARRVLSP